MRARNTQKAILANSTSFRSNFLNCFDLQPTPRYNFSNTPHRMNNQVVNMDIDASRKRNATHQKQTYDGKPNRACFNCEKPGHFAANYCALPRGIQLACRNWHKPVGRGNRGAHGVDVEDEDGQESPVGEDSRLYWGLEEGSSNCDHRQVPQPGDLLEHTDSFLGGEGPHPQNGVRYILPNGWWSNGPIHDAASIQVLFQEIRETKAKVRAINSHIITPI